MMIDRNTSVPARIRDLMADNLIDLDRLCRTVSEGTGITFKIEQLQELIYYHRPLGYDLLLKIETALDEQVPRPRMNGHQQMNGHTLPQMNGQPSIARRRLTRKQNGSSPCLGC
jgi:hypothetical protein